jgi:threonine dehydratase
VNPPSLRLPSPTEVRDAAARIGGTVRRTPMRRSAALAAHLGGEVHLKLETEQLGGSFKLRGALNAMLSLTPAEREAGVAASSAGNHGLGIAIASELLGVRATVFVPYTAPVVKRAAIAAHGVRVEATQPTYDTAETAARAFARDTRGTFISPCTGRALLAGQGTVALEILTDLPSVRTLVVCVGGGGLVGGIGGYVRGTSAGVRILGAQSVRTNAMALALAAGRAVTIPDLPTLADGLAGLVDDEMYAQGKASLDAIVAVEEEEIAAAIRWLHLEEGIKAEGAGAVGVAALLTGRLKPQAFPVVVTVSGGNIDAEVWNDIVRGEWAQRFPTTQRNETP